VFRLACRLSPRFEDFTLTTKLYSIDHAASSGGAFAYFAHRGAEQPPIVGDDKVGDTG